MQYPITTGLLVTAVPLVAIHQLRRVMFELKTFCGKAMKVITISLLTAVSEIRLFLIFLFLGVAQDKMEAVEVYNKVQRYREEKHQT